MRAVPRPGEDRLPSGSVAFLPDPLLSQERYARAAWSRIAEPSDVVAHRLISAVGPVAALEAVVQRSESALDRFRPRLAALDVVRDLEIAAKFDARLLVPGDPQWPAGVDDLAAPPYCLWVRGPADLAAVTSRSAAVVGARAATAYGETLAADLGAGLAERGFGVVSGAAFGIDAAAHRGVLAVEGSTVAVLAGGVERAYPAAHKNLIDRIAEQGAVVSEVAPGSSPTKSRFLQRNRLIATMTRGTVVVEAGLRSGSRHTAATASDHSRVVLACPGPVTSPASAGCHEMIRSGQAALVTDAADAAEALGRLGVDLAPARRGPDRVGDDLGPLDRRLFEALAHRERGIERLAVVAGLAEHEVRAGLVRLHVRGLALRSGEGWRRAPVGRR